MTEHKCTCAVCMGFRPWVTDFAECMQKRFTRTWAAITAGEATEVMRVTGAGGEFVRWTAG